MFNSKKAGLSGWVISLVVIAFFSFCIFSFAYNFILNTNPSSNIVSNSYMNNSMSSMNKTINSFTAVQTNVYNQMEKSQPSAVDYLFLIFQGAFYIPLAFLSFIFTGIGSIMLMLFLGMNGTGFQSLAMGLGIITSGVIIITVLLIIQGIRNGQTIRS